jgi:ABC-type phosphate transport system substrate-binding protein
MPNRPLSNTLGMLALCAFSCASPLPVAARADVYVVVSPENPQRPLTRQEVVDLFLGRHRNFSRGEAAVPLDLPRDDLIRQVFYSELTGMTSGQLGNYWTQLTVGGHTKPPQVVPSEAEVARVIKENPSAIGYLSLGNEPMEKGLRIVFFLKGTE